MATATEKGAKTEAGKTAAAERVQNQGKTEAKSSRRVLTPAERVAKAEADLKAAKEAAEKAERSRMDKARERRESLVKRINPLISQLNEVNVELDYPRVDLTPVAAES